jgi:hypothetical protein
VTYASDPPASFAASAAALAREVEATSDLLRRVPESTARRRPGAGGWSAAEVVGHLVDSAVNNLGRFVRAQEGERVFPGYSQDAWVERQGYADAPWPELVDLWRLANRQIVRAVERIDPAVGDVEVRVGEGPSVTVAFLVDDYVAHLRHHVRQIVGLLGEAS